ncbi:MAG: N-ethylammeline chlorohydrolase [Gammaproteobacteria bacterium]|nr:MAG: N-ethylammeline chlorohydrolase [Gammaproteobacteria bacterium]
MNSQATKLLIKPQWLIPIDHSEALLTEHSVLIENDTISAIIANKDLDQPQYQTQLQGAEVLELPGQALLPGFVNAHGHSAMSLFRGLADDLPLNTWLNDHIWPAEAKWVSEEFVHDGSQLAIAEMLRSGTTCFADMYFFPEVTAKVAQQNKIRCRVNTPILDFPTVWAQSADEYIHKGLQTHDDFRASPLVSMAFGPHSPYTLADKSLEKIAMLADELDIGIHMHVAETAFEVDESLKLHNKRPLQRLDEIGLLTPKFQAVHMTQISEPEFQVIASRGIHVIHCPESNLKLASGFCPAKQLLDLNVNVALGTDGAASNNDLDMLGETRTAALLAKAVAEDAAAFSALEALTAATLGGAKALGLQDQIGSISPGKQADLMTINLHTPDLLPIYNPISQIVYSASRHNVAHVWVAGQQLLQDGQLTLMDSQAIIDSALSWQDKISNS